MVRVKPAVDFGLFQSFLQTVNPAEAIVIKVHPYRVFEDSLLYLWDNLDSYFNNSYMNVQFVDDDKVEPNSWFHSMAAQIFAPSSQLFQAVRGADRDGASTYDINTKLTSHEEGEQCRRLQVAVYAQILDPTLGLGSPLETQTVAEARRSAFIRGIHDIIRPSALSGITSPNLEIIMHGVSFEELPHWRPIITAVFDELTSQDFNSVKPFAEAYNSINRKGVAKLWELVGGMQRIPPCELVNPQGFLVSNWDVSELGMVPIAVDPSRRLLKVSPSAKRSSVKFFLENAFPEILTEYSWFRYLVGRQAAEDHRPLIEIRGEGGEGELFASLDSITRDPERFVKSRIVLVDRDDLMFMGDYHFYFIAFNELFDESPAFSKQSYDPKVKCPILEISVADVADEDAHLQRLRIAGMVVGKAIYESAHVPFALSARLGEMIRSRPRPAGDDEGGLEQDSKLHLRSAAFIEGIYQVIPAWLFSSMSTALLNELIGSSARNLGPIAALEFARDCAMVQAAREKDQEICDRLYRWFKQILNSLSPSRITLLFLYLFERPHLSLVNGFDEAHDCDFVYDSRAASMIISKHFIQVPFCEDKEALLGLLNAKLRPAGLVGLLAGFPKVDFEETLITVPDDGQIFPVLFASYQQEGPTKFFQRRFRVVFMEDGHTQCEVEPLLDIGFLLLQEALNPDNQLFTYTLNDVKGWYDIAVERVEDEDAHLSKLSFIGAFIARLVLEEVTLEFPIGGKLQELIYGGEVSAEKEICSDELLLRRQRSFLDGFYSLLPPKAIRSVTFSEWQGTLEEPPSTWLPQRNVASSYEYFLRLSRLRLNWDSSIEEGHHSTWEAYVGFIEKHLRDCTKTLGWVVVF